MHGSPPSSLISIPAVLITDDDDEVARTMAARSLPDVPEEGPYTPTSPTPGSPYSTTPGSSTTTLNVPTASSSRPRSSKKSSSSSSRSSNLARSSSEALGSSSSPSSSRRTPSVASIGANVTKDARMTKAYKSPISRKRSTPQLPHDANVELVPSTPMYWSHAPVYGTLPTRTMRGHTVTLVENVAWVFGGCDNNETSKEMYCFDVETMQWSHPETMGDIPNPSRAHTATLVDRKIVIYGGGQATTYYDTVYIFDTVTRRWTRPTIAGETPYSRRAHSAVLYKQKIWVFGGGNGMMALNDVWTLDVSALPNKMKWTQVQTYGSPPSPRGYHSANLVDDTMLIIGGSDGKDCFSQIWTLNLETLVWREVSLKGKNAKVHKRLSHSSTQVGSYLFVQGGHNGTDYLNDIIFFNLVNMQYENRIVHGKPPSIRGYHVSILTDSRLFFFGGYDGQQAYDDVFILDLAASAYLPQVTSFRLEFPEDMGA